MLNKLYLPLSSFYFFYCAVLGAVLPYFGVFLKENNFSTSLIALTSAILLASNIVAPNFWGWLTDKFGRRIRIIRLGNLLACLAFMLMFWVKAYWAIIVVVIAFSFCWQGLIAQFEVVTLEKIENTKMSYGKIRMWGSVGFVSSVSLLGVLFEQTSIDYFPHVTLMLFILLWLSTLLVDDADRKQEIVKPNPILETIKKPAIILLLAAITLVNVSHGIYYTFFSIYLEGLGYSTSIIGTLWTIAVVAEILMFLVINRLFKRYNRQTILLVSLFMALVRWGCIAFFSDSIWVLIFSQTLHAFTFSAIHSVMMERIKTDFKKEHQGRAQAIYNSVCVSAGAAIGAGVAGWLWDWSNAGTFMVSTGVAGLALLITWLSGLTFFKTKHLPS
ncbi:MFS transporter [Thalassotalea agariperforans]